MADAPPKPTENTRLGIWMMLVIALILVSGLLGAVWLIVGKKTTPPDPGAQVPSAPGPDNTVKTFEPGQETPKSVSPSRAPE
jgi:hypothetical protein